MNSQPVVRIKKHQGRSGCGKKMYYWFTLVAENGERLTHSETYTRKASRDRTVRLLLRARMEESR